MEPLGYDSILVPTDMSDFSSLALRYAALFRERLGSKLTLLYADQTVLPFDMMEAPLGYYLENARPTRERLVQRFTEWSRRELGGDFNLSVVDDAPAHAITTVAEDIGADLIIMGTHGRTGIRRAILGSVTENVLHHTDVPLLTVTPPLMPDVPSLRIRRILCPVNFTHVARLALEHAAWLAETFDAELDVTYVIEAIAYGDDAKVETAFRHWVEPQVLNRCCFNHIVVRDQDPAERVLALAAGMQADLIVMGAQHRFFADATVLGTTTQRITRFARVPVLTVTRRAVREAIADVRDEAASDALSKSPAAQRLPQR